MALLEVKSLGIAFGGLKAVDGFNISVETVSYTHLGIEYGNNDHNT